MNRTKILWLAVMALTATAGQADELYDELLVCRDLPSAVARLDCYDAALDRSNQQGSSGPAAVTPPPAPVEPAVAVATGTAVAGISQEELFGQDTDKVQQAVEQATGDERIDSIGAKVTQLQQYAYEKVVISLDNGQVWKQIDSSSLRLSVGDDVIIERAALGSFMLKKSGSKRTMRVSRRD